MFPSFELILAAISPISGFLYSGFFHFPPLRCANIVWLGPRAIREIFWVKWNNDRWSTIIRLHHYRGTPPNFSFSLLRWLALIFTHFHIIDFNPSLSHSAIFSFCFRFLIKTRQDIQLKNIHFRYWFYFGMHTFNSYLSMTNQM